MTLSPITSLYLDLPSVESRAHFKSRTRREPPIHDPAKPIKKWSDPSKLNMQPDQRVTYLALIGDALSEITMSAFDAVNVNLPDVIESGATEVPWPCRPLATDERMVMIGGAPMVEKGTQE